MPDDVPIIPEDSERGPVVIDLAEVRIAWGRAPHSTKPCGHRSLVYCQAERRVWCEDCERSIDGFDAFLMLTRNFQSMLSDVRQKQHDVDKAHAATIVRRAAKEFDRAWSSNMAPACPHCNTGLLPEDFAKGASASFGRDYELARRARKARETRHGEG